jgi:hypothetical protein
MSNHDKLVSKIDLWFHTEDYDDITPADTVSAVADDILIQLKSTGFELAYSNQKFRVLLCEFICTLYHASLTEKNVSGPHTAPKLPESWTDEIYMTWIDYLHYSVFTESFWEDFWTHIPTCKGLQNIRNWEAEIQALIPYLMRPDHEQMITEGLLFEDNAGNVITAEDYDSSPEDYRNWY